jgi:hypothetical protein
LNSLKRFFDFILFGNIYVSLGAVCLVQSTVIQLHYSNHLFFYSLLVFFSTLFVYNFQRIFYKSASDNNLNSVRRKWIFKNRKLIKLLLFSSFSGVAITFFFNDYHILFYLSPLLVLSLFYFIPFIKLRKSPWLKLLTLVTVWTFVTAVTPLLLSNTPFFTSSNILHIFVRFCFMIAICIPFDIRDLKIDQLDSTFTIPQLLGENRAKWLAFSCMILYSFLIVLEYFCNTINLNVFMALLISAVINAVLVLMSTSKRSEYFYVAGIDGTMILQGVLLMWVYYL